jgi:hypothetical protein
MAQRKFFYGSSAPSVQGNRRRLVDLAAGLVMDVDPPKEQQDEPEKDDDAGEGSDSASHGVLADSNSNAMGRHEA